MIQYGGSMIFKFGCLLRSEWSSREISAVFAFYIHKLYFEEIINYPFIKPVQPKNKYIDDLRQSLKMIEDEKRCQAIFDNIEFDLDN